jgi:hypothetical protein
MPGDAATSGDAGKTDAVKDASVIDAGPSYCDLLSQKPTFCDDFDHGAGFPTWDALTKVSPGTATLDMSTSASAPFSLFIQTANTQGVGFGTVLLRKTVTVAAPATHARLSFSFNPESGPPTVGSFGLATLDLSTSHLFTLYLRDPSATPGAALVEAAATETRFDLGTALPPPGTWTRIVIDLDLANARANVLFGATHVLTDAAIGTGTGTQPTIRVGALAEATPAVHARFDDVLLEVE